MLQRRWAHDQHALDAGRAGKNLDGGDGLDRLAQAHVVGHQRAAGLGGKQRPFALIRIERDLQQLGEGRRANPPRKRRRHALGQLLLVADLGDILQGVVVAAELMPVGRGGVQKLVKLSERLGLQTLLGVEVPAGELSERGRALRARPEHDFPPRAILQIDLGVWRLMAQRQLPLRARPAAQFAEHVFDVFAGSQRIDGKVGARAEVLAQRRAADRHPIRPLRGRIGHLEVREQRLIADVFHAKLLCPAELPPQPDLPLLQRHLLRLPQPRQAAMLRLHLGVCPRFCHHIPPRYEIRVRLCQFSTASEDCLAIRAGSGMAGLAGSGRWRWPLVGTACCARGSTNNRAKVAQKGGVSADPEKMR